MPLARRTKYHNKAFSRKQPPLVLAEAIFQAVGFDNSTAGLFLLLTRLCFPETCCKITSVPETKALDPARTIQTRGVAIPLVRTVLRYTQKSSTLFFLRDTARLILPTSRNIVSSVAIFACSSGAFPSGRVHACIPSRLRRFLTALVFFSSSRSGI